MGEVWTLALDHPEQSILLAMADNAHDDGSKCFPGVEYLAWKTGYKRRQVQRILRSLETQELIRALRLSVGGRGLATEYRIQIEKGVKKTPFKPVHKPVDKLLKREDQKGVISDQNRVIHDQKGVIAVTPQPSEPLEPSYPDRTPSAGCSQVNEDPERDGEIAVELQVRRLQRFDALRFRRLDQWIERHKPQFGARVIARALSKFDIRYDVMDWWPWLTALLPRASTEIAEEDHERLKAEEREFFRRSK